MDAASKKATISSFCCSACIVGWFDFFDCFVLLLFDECRCPIFVYRFPILAFSPLLLLCLCCWFGSKCIRRFAMFAYRLAMVVFFPDVSDDDDRFVVVLVLCIDFSGSWVSSRLSITRDDMFTFPSLVCFEEEVQFCALCGALSFIFCGFSCKISSLEEEASIVLLLINIDFVSYSFGGQSPNSLSFLGKGSGKPLAFARTIAASFACMVDM